jgi:hypothetical protein
MSNWDYAQKNTNRNMEKHDYTKRISTCKDNGHYIVSSKPVKLQKIICKTIKKSLNINETILVDKEVVDLSKIGYSFF